MASLITDEWSATDDKTDCAVPGTFSDAASPDLQHWAHLRHLLPALNNSCNNNIETCKPPEHHIRNPLHHTTPQLHCHCMLQHCWATPSLAADDNTNTPTLTDNPHWPSVAGQ